MHMGQTELNAAGLGGLFTGTSMILGQVVDQPWYVGIAAIIGSALAAALAASARKALERYLDSQVSAPAIALAIDALRKVRERGGLPEMTDEALLAAEVELARLQRLKPQPPTG